MAGCIMLRKLKKVALGVVIVLAGWSAVAAQQTSPSQQTKPPEAEETIGLPPKIDQLKAMRAEAEAAKDLNKWQSGNRCACFAYRSSDGCPQIREKFLFLALNCLKSDTESVRTGPDDLTSRLNRNFKIREEKALIDFEGKREVIRTFDIGSTQTDIFDSVLVDVIEGTIFCDNRTWNSWMMSLPSFFPNGEQSR